MTTFSNLFIFCVQDRTGTVVQVSPTEAPENPVEVGDTGIYTGVQSWSGRTVSIAFTVNQLVTNSTNGDFGITTALGPIQANGEGSSPGTVPSSAWPESGSIAWTSGSNEGASPDLEIQAITSANAYITPAFLAQYSGARGNFTYPDSPAENIQQAIVQASDYLDQRYRYKGIKLQQFLSNGNFDPSIGFLDPWLAQQGFLGGGPGTNYEAWFTPSSTQQVLEWPRQGCIDFNGDTVFGIPQAIKYACAELALRALNGTVLQPDYDPNLVGNGGVVESSSQEVGPIKVTKSYNIQIGLGFFADFPQVKRILQSAGLLIAGGGRSIIL